MKERLTKKEKGFADDYLETGEQTKAILDNYDIGSKGGKTTEEAKKRTASSMANENLKKLDIQKYLKEHAGGAITRIEKLSKTAKNETVKLNANKDILDRAGFKPTEKKDITSGGDKIQSINYIIPDANNNKTDTKTTPSI